MENIIEIFKTPTYSLINNYNVESYTRKIKDNEELFETTNDVTTNPEKDIKEIKDGIKKVGTMIAVSLTIFIIVQFTMLSFIMNRKKKLSSLYTLCIIGWWLSWFFPILIIPLIIVILIAK
jgi:hypothetical protein